LLLENLSNAEIAGKLNIAERTVKFHLSNLLNKFVRRRADLILLTSVAARHPNSDVLCSFRCVETVSPRLSLAQRHMLLGESSTMVLFQYADRSKLPLELKILAGGGRRYSARVEIQVQRSDQRPSKNIKRLGKLLPLFHHDARDVQGEGNVRPSIHACVVKALIHIIIL
jgi:hypothetical protein